MAPPLSTSSAQRTKRSPGEGRTVMVILYAVVTFVQAGRHRQFENDPVSFFPLSLKNGKTSFDRWVDLLSIYRNHPLFGRRVQVTVQFAGHELVARPGGDAHMQAEGGRLLRVEGDFDPAIVGVVRFWEIASVVAPIFNSVEVSAYMAR